MADQSKPAAGQFARRVSLAPLSLPYLGPAEFLSCAARAGFRDVALRAIPGDPRLRPADMPCLIDPRSVPELVRQLDAEGLSVTELEYVLGAPGLDLDACEEAFGIGATLGARWIVMGNDDPDPHAAADRLAAIAERGARFGMGVVVEFVPYAVTRTLDDAAKLVSSSGSDAHILIDAFHLARSGGLPTDPASYPGELFPYLQICGVPDARSTDIADIRREAREARGIPGSGSFDLAALIASLPEGLPLSIEAPDIVRIACAGPLRYAIALREAVDALVDPISG